MASSMNKVIIIGRLGKDPESSQTNNGSLMVKLSVATDEGYRDKQTGQKVDKTEWHRVIVWRKSAEFCSNYLSKGRLVMVEGKLQTRKWQDQNGQDRYSTEIVADNVSALDSPRDNQAQPQQPNQQPQNAGYNPQYQGAQPPYPQQNAYNGHSQQGQGVPYMPQDPGPAFPGGASGAGY